MYKKILVPLDGSHRAEAILTHVEELATCFEATVVLLEVIEPVPVIVDAHESVVTLQMDEMKFREQEAKAYLNSRVGEFRQKGIKVGTRIVNGPVVDAILSLADSEAVDLIAMASHGRGGLERMVFGSVAEGVLHRANKPMLLVRSRG
jgi:nucleotide-binding universal stress UspA family protein